MKGPVGKPIDCEDVAVLTGEPVLKKREVIFFHQLPGGEGGESQSDGVGFVAPDDLIPDLEGVLLQHTEGFCPGLGRMNVGAIGEMMLVVEVHGMD